MQPCNSQRPRICWERGQKMTSLDRLLIHYENVNYDSISLAVDKIW